MKAVDTNIVVRYLVRDDPDQTALADRTLAEPAFLSLSVLLETVWLLASRYGLPRERIGLALQALLLLPSLTTQDDAGIAWAIDRFSAGADFADMIHLLAASSSDVFVTFDRKFERQAGPDAPIPIETLA